MKRILLKVSGELLSSQASMMDDQLIDDFIRQVRQIKSQGIGVGIVIGGGNILRGGRSGSDKLQRATADRMGMLATMMNALALNDLFQAKGVDALACSARAVDSMLPSVSSTLIQQAMANGQVIIFAGGTGNPFVTTDSAAALRSIEMSADALFKLTTVDGVYDKDPNQHADAQMYQRVTFTQVLEKQLNVMDYGAFVQCRDFNIPICVFNMKQPGALQQAVLQGDRGTWVVKGE